jgi:MoaA/NifB/PqqE/SkfB family radical SAM enzyme
MKSARTVGFKRGERNIFFHILTACNLSCSHCYINPEQHGTQTLPIATIKKWLDLFVDPSKKSNVIFLGGEPTMHKDLPEAVRYAKKKGLAVTVDSNGYLLHDFLDHVGSDDVDFLSFSLDGPTPEVNDPIRGEGVFEVCVANIKKAVASGFNVSLIYTVSAKNIHHLEQMIPLLKHLGVTKFFIQVVGLRGKSARNESPDSLQVGREEWLSVVPVVAAKVAQEGIKVTYPKVFLDQGEEFACAGIEAENYFIFPNGRVYRCPLCEDHPIHALRVENDSLIKNEGLTEDNFFQLNIGEGCVMNKLLQPHTIEYDENDIPLYRISCCLIKQEIE